MHKTARLRVTYSTNDDITGTSYPKPTIKPYKIHHKYDAFG